jgi:cytochrome c-type biogenesis protein CcmE
MNKSKRRLFLVLSLLFAGGALSFISFGNIGENLVYYWDPSQIIEAGDKAYGATIRLGGVVKVGTLNWNEESNELNFEVSDGTELVKVHATGAPPQMFREGIGVVVEGTMVKGGFFQSDRLMVKHSNEYKAPEEGTDSKDLYKTVEDL